MTPEKIWLVVEITSMTANIALKGIGASNFKCNDYALLEMDS
jgi:hypothetical protein